MRTSLPWIAWIDPFVSHAKVDLADTGDAGRGLVARQRIKQNEALLRVPEGTDNGLAGMQSFSIASVDLHL